MSETTSAAVGGQVERRVMFHAHTPGPWSVMSGYNYEIRSPLLPREYPHLCKEDSTGDFVAYVGNHAPDFGEANARLISAAPDLLAALQCLLDRYVQAIGNEGIECRQARIAIAKAIEHET